MTAPDLDAERRMLNRLIGFADDLVDYHWTIEGDGTETHILAHRNGEVERIATIHRAARAEEMEVLCRGLETLRFTLGLIGRAKERIRALVAAAGPTDKPQAAQNLGFSAKSLCEQQLFWRFLESRSQGLGRLDSERAADTRLKGLLAISSKGELNRDGKASAAFLALKNDYYRWKRGEG